jgi:hypothetical protein
VSTASFRAARARRDFRLTEAIGRELLTRNPDQPAVLRGLARTLTELGREADAAPFWTKLRNLDPSDAEAPFHLARRTIGQGVSPEEAVSSAAPDGNELLRHQLVGLLQSDTKAPPDDVRHVAICGVSFCGSTLLDRVLAGLPGARSIGESHWLTKEHDGVHYVPINLGRPRSGRGPFCSVCGPKCAVLTAEFRNGLVADATGWYQRIAAQLRTSLLISADKNLPKLIDLDPLLRFSALVTFKSPEQAWASQLAKLPKGLSPEKDDLELARYMDVWTASYRNFLDDFEPEGGKTFLFFDDFARNPKLLLAIICARLQIPYDPTVLEETRPGHAIGGNKGAMARLRAADYGVGITPLPELHLPEGHSEMIARNRVVQDCSRELMLRYRGVFGRAAD